MGSTTTKPAGGASRLVPARHPAKFSGAILERADEILVAELDPGASILDPFAGTGRGVEYARERGFRAVGVELEPEWAHQSPNVYAGSALALPWPDDAFDAIFTSPCYGNRMADHHEAKDGSRRHTYRHALGRPLSDDNAGALQWGDDYRWLHYRAWKEAVRVLKPGGVFLLNCKDHIRGRRPQHVTAWHTETLCELGLQWAETGMVDAPGNRHGQNGESRLDFEWLVLLRKP